MATGIALPVHGQWSKHPCPWPQGHCRCARRLARLAAHVRHAERGRAPRRPARQSSLCPGFGWLPLPSGPRSTFWIFSSSKDIPGSCGFRSATSLGGSPSSETISPKKNREKFMKKGSKSVSCSAVAFKHGGVKRVTNITLISVSTAIFALMITPPFSPRSQWVLFLHWWFSRVMPVG